MATLDAHDPRQSGRVTRKSARLKNHLVAQLAAGKLRPGALLPSENSLARQHGVSRPTVRRALADMEREGLIRREQRRGTFVTEDAHRRLQQDSGTFVLLLPETRSCGVPIIEGFERACKALHAQMIVCDSENDVDQQADLILRLLRRDIAGIAVMPTTTPPTPAYHVLPLQERGIPVVFCHRGVPGVKAPLLALANEEIGRLAGEAVRKRGHRRAALFFPHRTEIMDRFERGLREAFREDGGVLPEEFVYCGETPSVDYSTQEKAVLEALGEMLGAPNPPTVIVTCIDQFAELVFLQLHRLGVRVPEDISLTSVGDIHRDRPIARQLAAVVIDEGEIGRKAVQLLHQMQYGSRPIEDDETTLMPLSFHEGETLGPAPRSRSLCVEQGEHVG